MPPLSGAMRWPRHAGRLSLELIARQPRSTSEPCATRTPLTSGPWLNCTKEWPAEYLLLDRLDDSEAALRAALRYRRELGDDLRIGEDLGDLSDVLFYQCRGEEGSRAAEEGLAVVQSLPPGPELAMALLNVGWIMSEYGATHGEAFDTIAKALDLAERLSRTDIVSQVLAMKGSCLINSGQDGIGYKEEGLRLAVEDRPETRVAIRHRPAGRVHQPAAARGGGAVLQRWHGDRRGT